MLQIKLTREGSKYMGTLFMYLAEKHIVFSNYSSINYWSRNAV
jgi:hypothetical protein